MRRFFISLILGLVVGIVGGLFVGWQVAPVQQIDSPMRNLSQFYKDQYTVMVAIGYQNDCDLSEAFNRLRPLGGGSSSFNVPAFVRDLTERYISEVGSGKESDIRSLVELSCGLGYCTDIMKPFLPPNLACRSGS